MKRLLLTALRDGPKTRGELVALVAAQRPELSRVAVEERTDEALTKLRLCGMAVREERMGRGVWRLAK